MAKTDHSAARHPAPRTVRRSGLSSGWRVWLPPAAAACVLIIAASFLIQMALRPVPGRLAEIRTDGELVAKVLRTRLASDREWLHRLARNLNRAGPAAGPVDVNVARDRLIEYLKRDPGPDHVVYLEEDLTPRWTATSGRSRLAGMVDPRSPELQRAHQESRRSERAVHAAPFRLDDGEPVLALWLRADRGDRPPVFLLSVYSLVDLLTREVRRGSAGHHHLALVLEGGETLASAEPTGELDTRLRQRVPVGPPDLGLTLVVTGYRNVIHPAAAILGVLCVGLGLGLAWITYLLRLKLAETGLIRDELRAQRGVLEREVAARTADLARTNARLESDIGERRRAEEALTRSEATLRSILVTVPLGIALSRNLKLEWCNGNLAEMFGYSPEELCSLPVAETYASDAEFRRLQERLQSEGVVEDVAQLRRKDGSTFTARLRLAPLDPEHPELAAIGIAEDISREIKAESGRQQAQKMQAIGTLAGGIAHDFNNILYAMMGYVQLAMDDLAEDSATRTHLEQVVCAGRRAADLVHHILTFSMQGEDERGPVRLQEMVADSIKLLRGTLPATIELEVDIDRNCAPVLAEMTQMHQVMMNLGANAFQAMRDEGGVLSVSLRECTLGPDELTELPELDAGRHVVLTVRDSGQGMDRHTRERAFEPYFTTKQMGEGTGMGLATVHGIVTTHGGAIRLESQPAQGSSIVVYLPVMGRQDEVDSTPQTEAITLPGRGVVLLVDDEKMIVDMGRESLERLGYEVICFSDAEAALDDFRADPHRYDLLITDQTMPRLTGLDLARAVLAERADLPVILISGYSDLPNQEEVEAAGIAEYLAKPIAPERLARVMSRLLGQREAEA